MRNTLRQPSRVANFSATQLSSPVLSCPVQNLGPEAFSRFSLHCMQWDQIGRFLKVLGNKFAHKSSPKSFLTFGLLWKVSIDVKLLSILFRQLLETFGQLFKSSIWSHCTVFMLGRRRRRRRRRECALEIRWTFFVLDSAISSSSTS